MITDRTELNPARIVGRRSGSALLITLLILSLITVIVVTLVGTMTWELSSARSDYENQKARSLAMLGMNTAMAQLRRGLDAWDYPYQNFATAPPTYYWSVSPGIITRWSYTSPAPITNYPLFSTGSTNLVNLNASTSDGTYPIAGGTAPPNISVYWANVLKDPSVSATSATNQIIGRYAFWVDDENAKININTADGTLKYTTNSVGLGTPSEVSLEVLQQGGANLTPQMATNIVYRARTAGFNSVREILRAPGSTPDLYTNNVFDLTTHGRSPEMNVFGEPKINLIPVSIAAGVNLGPSGNLQINAITLQPLTEIYPTPYQLPPYLGTNACQPGLGTQSNPMRPEVMSQEWPIFGVGGGVYYFSGQEYQSDRQGYMSDMLSRYLGGTNGMNMAIQWPVFPYPSAPLASATSSGAGGFVGKYSLRQLDALAVQITDLAGKAITPDAISQLGGNIVDQVYPLSVPSSHGGLLSHQLVPGLGRSPRINEILIELTTVGAVMSGAPPAVTTPPSITMALYLETYLPAGFAGVDLLNINNGLPPAGSMQAYGAQSVGNWEIGGAYDTYEGCLNLEDLPSSGLTPAGAQFPRPVTSPNYASIPRVSPQPYAGSPNNQTNDYWCDTLLQNNVGIDFTGNDPTAADPDQIRANAYHQGFPTNSAGQYLGSGSTPSNPSPLLRMGYLSDCVHGAQPGLNPWYPGQYRTVDNDYSASAYYMMTNAAAAVTNVTFSGGLIINGATWGGGINDPIMTPFESSVRGNPVTPGNNGNNWDGETISSSARAWSNPGLLPASPGNPAQTTYSPTELLRDRIMTNVIPVNFSAPIPTPSMSAAGPINQTWYHAEVADPLVNEFAGDWITNGTSDNTMGAGNGSPPTINTPAGGFATYYNGHNVSFTAGTVNSPYYDPDSFWMPTLDPLIPRSARMPNIGYLNYQRTGVIPDNETVAVNVQHGTPYRCLNFNAVNDASQMGAATPFRSSGYYYPDWALLDLFTIPSTLLPYHGPYGYYQNGMWQTGSIMTGNPTNMYNYGTWGGSTPGRINPNGAVIYTTNANIPTTDASGNLISRTLPLQALLYGLKINQTIASGTSAATATANAPTFTGGTTLDSTASANIASAIATYIGTYGPLREPAEICNIPAISTNYPHDSSHYNPTRNDLVRQIVGNLTTQSNTFSIWVAGQSISKIKSNINYGIYEPGDQITASVRYHFIVERYLEMGADGILGNATLPAGSAPTGDIDRIVGTYDDPMSTLYHPANPRYLYRIVYAEEIRN